MQALKKWNSESSGTWCVPRKGSNEHAQVKALMAGEEKKEKPKKPKKPKKEKKEKAQTIERVEPETKIKIAEEKKDKILHLSERANGINECGDFTSDRFFFNFDIFFISGSNKYASPTLRNLISSK